MIEQEAKQELYSCLHSKKLEERELEQIKAGGEYLNNMLEKMAKEHAKAIDDAIIRFLRRHGYKPRRTEKYAKNLKKKLEKQGLSLKIEEVILEEKFTDTSYYKKVVYVPSFIHMEEIGGNNGYIKDI